jgi:hypothetical protein
MPLLFEIEFLSPVIIGKKLEKGFTRIILSPYVFESKCIPVQLL